MSANQLKNVLIVGGGAAGAAIAKELSASIDASEHNLILINPRPFYLHRIASIRANVTPDGNFDERMQIPYDGIFTNNRGKLVVGSVTSIVEEGDNGGYVELTDGEKIPYAVLVLATGSRWDGPASMPHTKQNISQSVNGWRSRIEKASKIVIVGGGAVGIELAGEIKEAFPPKTVTIVHGQEHLLNDAYPAKYRSKVERAVRAKGIELALNDIVPEKYFAEATSETTITTKTGRTLEAELLISARGARPNTGIISTSLGENILNAAGQVKITPTFQLSSHPRIFAAGDITDIKEQKQAMKAGGHAPIVAANVLAVLNGQKPPKKYKGAYEIMALTVGKGGVSFIGALWGIIFGNWVTSLLKSKDLFVNMTRSGLGV